MRRIPSEGDAPLSELYGRYRSVIFNLARHALDRGAAEDIVQEVFLRVWQAAPRFTPARGSFRGWVLQIARFCIRNELRRRGRRPNTYAEGEGPPLERVPTGETPPDDLAWHASVGVLIRSAVRELPPPQRYAVYLAFYRQLPHTTVAAKLGIPLGTAKTRIRTGLRALGTTLAPRMERAPRPVGGLAVRTSPPGHRPGAAAIS